MKASSSVEMTRQPSKAEKETDRQTYCCSARDMWRTTDSRRMGWASQAELKRLIWNQQEYDRPATGGNPRLSEHNIEQDFYRRPRIEMFQTILV